MFNLKIGSYLSNKLLDCDPAANMLKVYLIKESDNPTMNYFSKSENE
jgi:hypothetical protein